MLRENPLARRSLPNSIPIPVNRSPCFYYAGPDSNNNNNNNAKRCLIDNKLARRHCRSIPPPPLTPLPTPPPPPPLHRHLREYITWRFRSDVINHLGATDTATPPSATSRTSRTVCVGLCFYGLTITEWRVLWRRRLRRPPRSHLIII